MEVKFIETQHILSLSYGKDSLACLGAIEQLGWPLDRIVHAEVWATDTIPADLPPMVTFKKRADAIIKKRWGVSVAHVCAHRKMSGNIEQPASGDSAPASVRESSLETSTDSQCTDDDASSTNFKKTYEAMFYHHKKNGRIYGFPIARAAQWCTGELKRINFPGAPLYKERI